MRVESQAGIVEKSVDNPPSPLADPAGIAPLLLAHYDRHARDLPWRVGPAARGQGVRPDPYHVWLSEIMLQQTTVAAVRGYFATFTARWPDIAALAAAPEAEVLAAWAGLGYYARARNLVRCARMVAGDLGGRFPDTEDALRTLPGIGAYSAAAIAAIAFDQPAVVVDANVERVVARLFGCDVPLPGAKPRIRELTARITPDARPGDFAQAMMDLGATICTPRAPRCMLCPLAAHCTAQAAGDPERLPVKAPRRARPVRRGTIWWIVRDDRVWLEQRPARGLLGGMRAPPDDGWSARRDGDGQPPLDGPWQLLETEIEHGFTHFSLQLRLALYRGDNCDMVARPGSWWPLADLDAAGLPTVFAKAARALTDTDRR